MAAEKFFFTGSSTELLSEADFHRQKPEIETENIRILTYDEISVDNHQITIEFPFQERSLKIPIDFSQGGEDGTFYFTDQSGNKISCEEIYQEVRMSFLVVLLLCDQLFTKIKYQKEEEGTEWEEELYSPFTYFTQRCLDEAFFPEGTYPS